MRAGSTTRGALALGLALGVLTACGSDDEPVAGDAPTAETTAAAEHGDHGDHGDHDMDHGDGAMDHGDTGSHEGTGHEHETDVAYDDLPSELRAQVDITKAYVERYETAADAIADGWKPATISLNGIGAHYLKGGPLGFGFDYAFDPAAPNVLLFDGDGPDAPIAGASFILTEPDPIGYPTELDVWHHHTGVCFDAERGLVIAEIDGHEGSTISMTDAQCREQGAIAFPIENLYMIHVWVAPDYIDAAPVFAHDHPDLYDGTTAAEQLPA